ncbi:polymer-forming cytoskeletal protein [Microbacterium foliorum]|uniref:polymer-forming cytoskeletal protein n=1 Tax=Microbacterium foliorum TaxID=104336 RepID=UPI0028D52C1F|nr:polymer-forming cytoskeletal protein [Microbacterium foliorum]
MTDASRAVRRCAVALSLGLIVLSTGLGAAATSPQGPAASQAPLARGDAQGPQFYSGISVDVSGTIDGDVYASAQTLVISGDISGDVIAAAQSITVTGDIEGNVRLSAQTVTISGDISRSGTILAADVTVTDTGALGDDLVGATGTMHVSGTVGRNLVLSVGTLSIAGSVGGDVTYVSDTEASIAEDAVAGSVERISQPQSPKVEVSPWGVFAGWVLGLVYALVALSLVTLFTALLLPRLLGRVTDHLLPSPWKALLVGLGASIVMPLALLLLFTTIVGAPLALAASVAWFLLTLASFPFVAHYLGALILRRDRRPVSRSLLGGVILIAALQIPWLNIVAWLLMVFFGLGAQLLEIHSHRPWHDTETSTTRPAQEASPASITL